MLFDHFDCLRPVTLPDLLLFWDGFSLVHDCERQEFLSLIDPPEFGPGWARIRYRKQSFGRISYINKRLPKLKRRSEANSSSSICHASKALTTRPDDL